MESTERFVDAWSEKPIPPRDQWDALAVNQLVDVKNQLEEKLWSFRSQPVIAKTLQDSVQYITRLIAERSTS